MSNFVSELRAAHSVFTAHRDGVRTIPEIVNKTGQTEAEVLGWVKALRLPLAPPATHRGFRYVTGTHAHLGFL